METGLLERRGENCKGISRNPQLGTFQKTKDLNSRAEYCWEKNVLGPKVDKAEAPWDAAGQHREFLWPCVCDLMLLGLQGSGPNKNVTTEDRLGKSKHAQGILCPELLALNLMDEDRTDFSEAKT